MARLEHRLPDSPSTNPRQQKRKKGSLGVENDIEEGVMHRQSALVLNKARFLECIQEGTDARTYMVPNHVNQHVLADHRNAYHQHVFLLKVSRRRSELD